MAHQKSPKHCFGDFFCKNKLEHAAGGSRLYAGGVSKLPFLRKGIDKTNKKVHNKFTSKYRHIQEHGFALRCEAQRNGVKIPDAERHCKVYVFSDGAAARSLAGAGKALRKERGFCPTHQVRIFGSNLHSWLSQRSSMQCIKTFAPRFEKTLVLFYSGEAERYPIILYIGKNDGAYKGCLESR